MGGVYVFLELRLGVGAVYDFRVTTGSLKFSAALFFPPEPNSPCTAEIDSGIEECALSRQFHPLTVQEEKKNENALWISKPYRMPTSVYSTTRCFALM